jgi:hypothetical protein
MRKAHKPAAHHNHGKGKAAVGRKVIGSNAKKHKISKPQGKKRLAGMAI